MLVLLYSIDPESAWFRFSLGFHGRVLCAHTSARRAGYVLGDDLFSLHFLRVLLIVIAQAGVLQGRVPGGGRGDRVGELRSSASSSWIRLLPARHRAKLQALRVLYSPYAIRRPTSYLWMRFPTTNCSQRSPPKEVYGSRAGRRRHGRRRTRIRICARRPLSESLRGHMGECGESAWRISIISHHGTPHQPEPSPCTSPAVHPCSSAHCCRCYRIISRARRADVWRLTLEIQYCICLCLHWYGRLLAAPD